MKVNNTLLNQYMQESILLCLAVLFFSQCTAKRSQHQDDDYEIKMVPEEYVEMSDGYKIDMSDYWFVYDNVFDRNAALVSYLIRQKEKNIAASELPTGDTTLASLNIFDTVPKSVFIAFAGYNSVNMWSVDRDFGGFLQKKEEAIARLANNSILYYCGQVMLSESFDSFMFLLNDTAVFHKYRWQCKDLFVVNMKVDSITSVANLFSCTPAMMIQTSRNANNIFHWIYYDFGKDPCYPNLKPGIVDEFNFKYDQDGQVVITRCTKDYYEEMNRRVEMRHSKKENTNFQ